MHTSAIDFDKDKELCSDRILLLDKSFRILEDSQVNFHWWSSMYTSLHKHNYCEFFVITKGKTLHTLNGVTEEIAKDTLCFIKPGDVHQFTPIGNTRCTHINMEVTTEKLAQICSALSFDIAALLELPPYKMLSENEFSFFLHRAEQISLTEPEADAVAICELIIEAAAILYRQSAPPSYPDWFKELLIEIHSPDNSNIKVKDIYAMSNYSTPALIKYFKKYTGYKIVDYLTRVKVNQACALLKTTDYTVTLIANMLGYDSPSHFNKIFKEATGLTPYAYKNHKLS